MDTFIIFYCGIAAVLGVFGINCHVMVQLYRRHKQRVFEQDARDLEAFFGGQDPVAAMDAVADKLPVVTTQLPIFNEMNVAERILEAVAAFHYPKGKHQIQVLDDSTDETRDIVARKVEELRARGHEVELLHRTVRTGYKAGALREGLVSARGEYVAIFDADFVPKPDFLLRTVPFFLDAPRIGFVQGRWDHLNRDDSLMTRMVSTGIDGHFLVEQTARSSSGLFMNFNGTVGVFRKAAIYDAGNWHDDTLTEDMDLSYRMQLKGWDRRFLPYVTAPGEVPADMNAFKNQQFRWAKGSIQTARKLLPRLWRSTAPLYTKVAATLHLTHYSVHLMMAFLAIAALPIIVIKGAHPTDGSYLVMGFFLILASTGPSAMYVQAQKDLGRNPWKTMLLMPVMVCFGCGMAVNNTRAVLEAFMGKPSGFERTPKKGEGGRKRYTTKVSPVMLAEAAVAAWCFLGVAAYWGSDHYLVGHFQLFYGLGFLTAAGLSWRHRNARA